MKMSFRRRTSLLLFATACLGAAAPAETVREPIRIMSPDRQLAVDVSLDAGGTLRYSVHLSGVTVVRESRLGLVRDDADFSRGLRLLSVSPAEPVEDRYEILTGKRRSNSYRANRRILNTEAGGRQRMDVIFQVSDGGVAFRYSFPETSREVRRIVAEESSFHMPPGTRAWLQPMSVAKSGWEGVNPCYEELYVKDVAAGTPSPTGAGWVYPALFRTGETWLLISETALGRRYAGTRLRSESPDGEYAIGFPDPREVFPGGPAHPESALPWITPWRLIVVGSLKTIVESTLGIDLADPPARAADATLQPGKASWSWPLLKDGDTTFDVQKRFVDYAAEMGWRYTLIDALWDVQIGYDKVKEIADYARGKGVSILLWYNSAGSWNTAPQTPRDLLLTHEGRVKEFARLKQMGIAGLKIDFFGGDGQSMIGYYLDILEDAAAYGLLVNFHGATLPRGWQRTYPNLMTMEAVRGLEHVTFGQKDADEEPTHAAMLPFTRNVFDPMDFTPMVLDRVPRVERRTTSAFELALSVLFTSGIQHYAEIPEGMAKAPDEVRAFLRGVPTVWEDVRFLDGHPGEFVVLARKGQGHWYVAGINGSASPRSVVLDLAALARGKATLITDGVGGGHSFRREELSLGAGPAALSMVPHGGFVMRLE